MSSNGFDHYPLLVEPGNIFSCGCPGFTYRGKCYHATQAAEIVTYQAEETEVKPVPVDGTDGRECNCPVCGAWMMA